MRDTLSILPDVRSQIWKYRLRPPKKIFVEDCEDGEGANRHVVKEVELMWRLVRRGFGCGEEGAT